MRLFLGIELPETTIDELWTLQKRLRVHATHGRFVAKSKLHLTLHFLGNVSVQQAEAIIQILDQTAQYHGPFSLALHEIRSFGNHSPLRVIWAGVGGETPALHCLQADIMRALSTLGFPRKPTPYQPHITLGRNIAFANENCLASYKNALQKNPFCVNHFVLFESLEEKGLHVYRALHTFSLK